MDPNITKANEYASAFEAFLTAHPIVIAIVTAIVCSWTLTAALKPWFPSGPKRARNLRTADCLIAAAIAAIMLHGLFTWQLLFGLCLLIGSGSPFAYWIVSELLCWKWPQLRKYLALRELANVESAEMPPPEDTP